MRALNRKTRIPTAVSLVLIFAYSMLMIMVPPTDNGIDPQYPDQASAPTQPDFVLRVNTADDTQRDNEPTL